MNYSNFLNYRLNSVLNKKVKYKNRYRSGNHQLSHKKNRLSFFLIAGLLSFSAVFAFVNYSTNNKLIKKPVSVADNAKLQNQTLTLELPLIAHHSEIETTPESDLKSTDEIEISLPIPTEKVSPIILKENHPVSQSNKVLLEKNTLIVINNNDSGNTQKVIISSSDSTTKIETQTKTIIVKKGDSLSIIFKRLSLSANTLYKIVNSGKQAKLLTKIKPGQKIRIVLLHDKFDSLHYYMNTVDTLIINKKDNKFSSRIDSKEVELRQQFASATIENSLFLAGNKAGLSSAMIMQMAQIFGWDIDFALDVRKGDSFNILYEEKFIDDKKFSNGHILSAEFINKGKSYKAVRFTDKSGYTDYYSEKGLSMRKAFLRTPVEFSRISSRFSYSRKHPVLNKTRAHKGVDYAASRGTPIKAVGKGKVIFKGTKGGYGRVIILQHGSKYSTLYAHMNSYNKNVRKGTKVKQGQTIGYVGSSGLATGPHLHYEFRVNGVHRNPLTVSLPTAAPIEKKYRNEFQTIADTLISQLKSRKQETIALKD